MKRQKSLAPTFAAVSLLLSIAEPRCLADSLQNNRLNNSARPTIKYDHNPDLAFVSSETLTSEANSLLKSAQFDRAIQLVLQILSKDGEKSEPHKIYAEALEGKLNQKTGYDPALFTKCIEEWLLFMRSQVREEGRLNVNGVGMSNFFFTHDERYTLARQHLLDLTGVAPRPWETDQRYLNRAINSAHTANSKVITPGPGL